MLLFGLFLLKSILRCNCLILIILFPSFWFRQVHIYLFCVRSFQGLFRGLWRLEFLCSSRLFLLDASSCRVYSYFARGSYSVFSVLVPRLHLRCFEQ
ncbi:hypothetical protein HHI36_001265 [Cryptolaemus montrouzieri]|uniref:Secreted protein n=1 Tax=Cryptolaemus montrouzieri TaxID=559131 RepID=A0ABD2P7A5_9CUCU